MAGLGHAESCQSISCAKLCARRGPELLGITGIPNARLVADVAAIRLLNSGDGT